MSKKSPNHDHKLGVGARGDLEHPEAIPDATDHEPVHESHAPADTQKENKDA